MTTAKMFFCIFTRLSYFTVIVTVVVNLESLAADDDGRQRSINDPQPFRSNKLNMMWAKAKQVMAAPAFHIR